MPQPGRGPGPGARAGRLLLLLAVLLALAIPATPAGATGNPYRVRHFELADVPYGRLSYTGEPVPALPHPRPRDSQGVPLYRGHDGTLHYRPGQIAINGMKRVDAYLDHGYKAQLDQALVQAARLRELAIVEREAWWLPFTFDYPPEGQKAPWFNAMAQGLALSYFARLYVVTGDEVHLDAARWVFRSFRRLGRWRRPWVPMPTRTATSGWSTIPAPGRTTCSTPTCMPYSASMSTGAWHPHRARAGCSEAPSPRCATTPGAIVGGAA